MRTWIIAGAVLLFLVLAYAVIFPAGRYQVVAGANALTVFRVDTRTGVTWHYQPGPGKWERVSEY